MPAISPTEQHPASASNLSMLQAFALEFSEIEGKVIQIYYQDVGGSFFEDLLW